MSSCIIKHTVNTNFLTQGVLTMKKALIALAAAAAISPAAFAGDVTWGGDANVEGYMSRTDAKATAGTETDNRGYTNLIRLKGTFKADGNVSVNTRLYLADGEFTGDDTAAGTYRNNTGDTVALDYGYIQAPIAGWTFRLGRQTANWANCFVTCDDRRDRLLAMKRFGGTTVILINDKRASAGRSTSSSAPSGVIAPTWTDANSNGIYDAGEETGYAEGTTTTTTALGANDETKNTGEGDMYAAAAVGVIKGWQWGFLVSKWLGEDNYFLQDVWEVSPTIKGKIGPVKVEGALNILGGGNTANNAVYFSDTNVSAYARAAMEMGSVNLEAQGVIVSEGGLISGGFDTFTMLINSNPDNNRSNTTVATIGSFGTKGVESATNPFARATAPDQWLLAVRASGKMGKFGWKASAAYFASEDTYGVAATKAAYGHDYTITTFDAGVTYAVAKTTELYLDAAIGSKSDDFTETVSTNYDAKYEAARVGITTTF